MGGVDPFADLDVPEEPTEAIPEVLEHRPSRAKRNRDWERKKRRAGCVVTYRGVPQDVKARVKGVAHEHHVPIGEVARRFLEYALAAYDAGDLTLEAVFGPGKLTLYPEG
jgi:hypothetical protein